MICREAGRQLLVDQVHRLRLRLEHLVDRRGDGVAFERLAAAEQFVEHDAGRKDVGAMIDIVAADLFRRHVVRRSDDLARLGHVGESAAGQAEVENLHAPIGASGRCSPA